VGKNPLLVMILLVTKLGVNRLWVFGRRLLYDTKKVETWQASSFVVTNKSFTYIYKGSIYSPGYSIFSGRRYSV